MLKELSVKEIEEILASHPKAKRLAVESFLMTVHYNDNAIMAFANLERDTKLYKWNKETVKAIEEGIKKAEIINRCPDCGSPLQYIYAENIWVCPKCEKEG